MVEISVEEILELHNSVVERFKITKGTINQGNLEAVVQRPETRINGEYVYKDVFSKAASILEGLIRWHPFADGNKRTALLATLYYLKLEGYGVAVPLSAVRYTVRIARNESTDECDTQKLIREIASWLNNHSARTPFDLLGKIGLYLVIPYSFLQFLDKIGFRKYVNRKIAYWMAFDIYPEYEKEADDIANFIAETVKAGIHLFRNSAEQSKDNTTKSN